MRRAAVTGMGVISPIGNDLETFSKNVFAGNSGISSIDSENFPKIPGGMVEYFENNGEFAINAMMEAMKQAEINIDETTQKRTAVILGGEQSLAGFESIYEDAYAIWEGKDKELKKYVSAVCGYNPAAECAAYLGIRGHVETISNACASGSAAIGKGLELIRNGQQDMVICGGSDGGPGINEISLFSVLNVLATGDDPTTCCRPFSKNRSGCVIGQGAGILILEDIESAKARGAHIFGEILGCGSASDTHHVTSPDMEAVSYSVSMEKAISSAGVKKDDIDYINAHGTGTYYNDLLETMAIKKVFGERAYEIPISSIKAVTGHLLCAAGAVECIATLLAIEKDKVPPNTNLDEADPACDLWYEAEQTGSRRIRKALSNSFGFGGQNTTLVLGGVDDR